MGLDLQTFQHRFIGAGAVPATNGWPFIYVEPTGTGFTATHASTHGGEVQLALSNANEAQVGGVYGGDVLQFDLNQLKRVEIVARIPTALGTGTSVVLGLGTARNSTLDSVTTNAWFRFEASGVILVETDDGSRDIDDVSSGITLGTTFKNLVIDFSQGLTDVRFFASDANGALAPILRSSGAKFDMSNASASNNLVQLIFEVQKTSSTQVGTVGIQRVKVDYVAQ